MLSGSFAKIIPSILLCVLLTFTVSAIAAANDAPNPVESVQDEDAFGGMMYTCMPGILESKGEIIKTDKGSGISFELTLSNACEDIDKYAIKTAWVYFGGGKGAAWNKVELSKTGFDTKKHVEQWTASAQLAEPNTNEYTPIVYFFRAEDIYGNISTELPETSPGWPPNVNEYFPGVKDMDNSEDIVPRSLDILNSFVARDKDNLYLIVRMEGDVDPGTTDPANLQIYTSKFTNPAMEPNEGLLVGNAHVFSPYLYANNDLFFNIKDTLSGQTESGLGRVMDECDYFSDNNDNYHIGVHKNLLYSSVPIIRLCPHECKMLNIIHFTAANASNDSFMLIPLNSSPFLRVYFQSHVIGKEVSVPFVSGDSGNEGLIAPVGDYKYEEKGAFASRRYKTHIYEGKGPFSVTPCDRIKYKNYYFEVYTRNGRIKLRIFRDDEWLHTLMIGNDTKPRRDEQHKTADIYITLSDFEILPGYIRTCDFEIKDLK